MTNATLRVEVMRGRARLRMSKAANARVSCENCPKRSHQRATMWLGVGNQGSNRKNLSKRFRKEGKLTIKHQPSPAIVSRKYHIPRRWQLDSASTKVSSASNLNSLVDKKALIQTSSERHGDPASTVTAVLASSASSFISLAGSWPNALTTRSGVLYIDAQIYDDLPSAPHPWEVSVVKAKTMKAYTRINSSLIHLPNAHHESNLSGGRGKGPATSRWAI